MEPHVRTVDVASGKRAAHSSKYLGELRSR